MLKVFQNDFASSVWYTGILSNVNDLQHGAFWTQIVTEDEQNTMFKMQKAWFGYITKGYRYFIMPICLVCLINVL